VNAFGNCSGVVCAFGGGAGGADDGQRGGAGNFREPAVNVNDDDRELDRHSERELERDPERDFERELELDLERDSEHDGWRRACGKFSVRSRRSLPKTRPFKLPNLWMLENMVLRWSNYAASLRKTRRLPMAQGILSGIVRSARAVDEHL
jgi:hypothetical protein